MDNKSLTIILLVASALILLLEISIFASLLPEKLEGLQAYKKQVNSTLSDQDFIKQLINQNIEYKESIDAMEREIADQNLVIARMAQKLNMSINVETSPFKRIGREDIKVYEDRIILYVNKAFTAGFTESRSMYPFISEDVYALEIRPQSPAELKVGDVIGYESRTFNATIIHRIIAIDTDESGWYAITKGDNNASPDPDKVRFRDVQGVLVGLIY